MQPAFAPENLYAEPTITALKAGKHVIREKPLVGDANDGQAMVNAQMVSGKVLQIWIQSRFGKAARALRKFYKEGFFGDDGK